MVIGGSDDEMPGRAFPATRTCRRVEGLLFQSINEIGIGNARVVIECYENGYGWGFQPTESSRLGPCVQPRSAIEWSSSPKWHP